MNLPVADTGQTILVTLGYLCLLLGVIFLAYWLLRKLGFHGMSTQGGKAAPRLVSRLMLGNRQSVAVIRYRETDLVIGVTEERISLLKEFDADQSTNEEDPRPAPKTFAAILKRTKRNEEQG